MARARFDVVHLESEQGVNSAKRLERAKRKAKELRIARGARLSGRLDKVDARKHGVPPWLRQYRERYRVSTTAENW